MIPIFLRCDNLNWKRDVFLGNVERGDIYNVDEGLAFLPRCRRQCTRNRCRPIDFVSLIENWLITNDDARKANFRVYYYRSSKHLKQIKRASRPGE